MATGQYVGEGFNYPRLDTMMLTMPISWEGNVEQYYLLSREKEDDNLMRVVSKEIVGEVMEKEFGKLR